MQKRLVRKLDLEIALSKVEPHPSPKAHLEQYTITAEVAAELLYIAAYINEDIIDKTVADLGCGTGRLAIGSALLGAKEAIGIDIDKTAIKTAAKNAEKLAVKEKTRWIIADIGAVRGNFDTVLQNPPFGVQRRRADRRFLDKALEVGDHIYSLHKSSEVKRRLYIHRRQNTPTLPSTFLKEYIERLGGRVKTVYKMQMTIPHMFDFHTRKTHQFPIDLYVIEKRTKASKNVV
jgi:putative methylase